MGLTICPKCGATVQETDTHCMECGANLAEAERELARKEKQTRGGGPIISDEPVVQGAAAGLAEPGETSEKVRLKEFDRQLARKLVAERTAVVITALIALVAGAGILFAGWSALKAVGGVEALRAMSYADLRERGLGAFADQAFISALLILLGLSGLLCMAGQVHRFVLAQRAVAQVRAGERPDVVGISSMTAWGLIIASFVCPPLGIILGIIFTLGQDENTRDLGGTMIKSALIAVAVVIAHLIWNAVAGFASQAGASRAVTNAAE
ncbi:MAG: zinc ribbon domain-containing protein [Armatimonadota bacterium]|nr:zinc ribbon domain-containing protein [Armatimonadota bacterium]